MKTQRMDELVLQLGALINLVALDRRSFACEFEGLLRDAEMAIDVAARALAVSLGPDEVASRAGALGDAISAMSKARVCVAETHTVIHSALAMKNGFRSKEN